MNQHSRGRSSFRSWENARRALLAVLVLIPIYVVAPMGSVPAHAASLPGGRANHVVTLIGGPQNHRWVKLAEYSFGIDGTVTSTSWEYTQDITGNGVPLALKVDTGYRTVGCQAECAVRTPKGFEPHSTDRTFFVPSRSGTWRTTTGGIVVNFGTAGTEVWAERTGWSSTLSLFNMSTANSTPPASKSGAYAFGQMYGSNWSLLGGTAGVSIASIKKKYDPASQAWVDRSLTASNWLYDPYDSSASASAPLRSATGTNVWFDRYDRCANDGPCISQHNTYPASSNAVHSYLVANPTQDARKVFWNIESGYITQSTQPGSVCISSGGGHTHAAIQIIDDNGAFIGLVGIEASLANRVSENAYIASYTLMAS